MTDTQVTLRVLFEQGEVTFKGFARGEGKT